MINKINPKKIAILFIAAVLFLLVLFQVNQFEKQPLVSTVGQIYKKAVVTEIIEDNLNEDGNRYGNQTIMIKLRGGETDGQEMEAINPNGTLFGAECKVGSKVIVMLSVASDTAIASIYSLDRTGAIYGFLLIFIAVVCLVGGKKGVKAIFSLAFTFICIIYLMFPLIYKGVSPILITVVVAILSTILTLGLLGGFQAKTLSAIAGTGCGVIIAAAAALLFGKAAGITGYNVSDIETLNYVAQNSQIHIGQLLFAGIIISALGAVMDVGMSIASTIEEVHQTDKSLSRRELFRSGMRVGRDMMGTMTNTLIFAYVGGSITTLITNYAYDLSYNQLMNSYSIGIEIMQGLSGSLGVVLTVPITALIASVLAGRTRP